MSKKANRHWAAINEVSFVAGMRLLFLVFRVCGRWPFRLMLYPVLLWYVLTQGGPRRASRAFLTRVRAQDPQQPQVAVTLWDVLQHFASFAETILDKMLLWGGLYRLDRVRFHGVEAIDQQIAAKRGTLLVCSHLGNLELCRVLSRQRSDLKVTVLVHTKHAQAFNHMLGQLDPASQLNLLQVTEMTPATAMLLSERIAQGEFVVIAGDRVPVSPNPRVVMARFLGEMAAFPIGPYVLASILQCPLYLLFCQNNAGQPEVFFELLRESVQLPRRRTRTADPAPAAAPGAPLASGINASPTQEQYLQQLASEYAARLEAHCLRAPLQWFNFYDFWHLAQMESADVPR